MPTEILTPQRILTRNPSIFASKVDDDLVMMNEKQGSYFGLNSVARKIWELLATPLSYDMLLHRLVDTYKIDIERCSIEVKPFFLQMIEHRLIHIE